MTRISLRRGGLRAAILATGLLALLGGCVIYPEGGHGGGHGGGGHYYWHGR